MPNLTSRLVFLLIFAVCAAVLLVALFMQHVMGLVPCYLCIVQRAFFVATGVLALVAALHNPGGTGIRLYGLLTGAAAVGGGGFAIRQLWLQSLPEDQVPACGPPADYLFDSFSFGEVLPMLLKGDGNCAKVDWTFLGLSIAGWSLVAFAALALLALWQVVRPRKG